MKKNVRWIVLLLLVFKLFSGVANAQLRISEKENDLLLLQLSSGFLHVTKQARIDMDSTLIITSIRHHLSRIPVITEGLDTENLNDYGWMDRNDSRFAIKQLKILKGKDHARLQLALGAFYAFRPGMGNPENGLAKFYLDKAKAECLAYGLKEWIAQADILLGKCYFESGSVDSAKSVLQEAIDYADKAGNKAIAAKANYYVGAYCPFVPQLLPYRIGCLRQAVSIYSDLNDRVNQANSLMDISYQSFAIGKLKEAEVAALTSLKLQREINFPYTHYTNDMLALLAHFKANYAEQLKIALDAVKTAEASHDSIGLGYFYSRVGESYFTADNHIRESNLWFKKAFDEFIKHGGDGSMYLLFTSVPFIDYELGLNKRLLVNIQNLLKNFPPNNTIDLQNAYTAISMCYEKLGLLPQAEKYLLLAEKLEAPNYKIRGDINNGVIYFRLSNLYIVMKNHKKNRFYIQKFLSINRDSSFLAPAYYNLFESDSALGDFSKMRNLYNFTMLKKKAYTRDKNRLVEELDVRYQTLQKQKDLEAYKVKNLLQSQQAATTRKFTIAGLLALVFVIITIWSRYHSKQKSNQLLQHQKEEVAAKNLQLEHVINEKDDLLISKEWLLKEVHHRVKNNLQLVMSLLNSQTAYLKDEVALNAVLESRHRVQAMSLIHQKLYKSDNASSINMRDYIKDLVEYLKDSFKTRLSIYFELRIDPVELDVSQAIPVGLILNELITNSIKYAFPFSADDRISILFIQPGTDEISLTFTDNGRGLPEEFDTIKNKSFGMRLIQGLAEDLGGEFSLKSVNGISVSMVFKTTDFYQREMDFDQNQHT